MERINYPIISFEFKQGFCLGVLVGTDYQVIEKDIKEVKTTLLSYLQKQYKKYDDYPVMDLLNPQLKMIQVNIRPAYHYNSGAYPMSYTLKVPIPVVYSETEQGHFECFLPLFEQSFYYYDPQLLETLVQHFITNLLNQEAPEKIFNLMKYPEPTLDFIRLKVNQDREFEWSGISYQRQFKALNRLTERYPLPKNVKKSVNHYPEVAWELEDVVSEVIDKLISTRSNVILVGAPGSGKSAVLRQAIRKISNQKKNFHLDFTFWRISSQRITSSTKYLGEWQEGVEALIDELVMANGILWVVDLSRLLQSGGQGPEDSVAAFISIFLQQGKLQLVGEATPEELESMRRLLPGFVEHFQIVPVPKLADPKIRRILNKFATFSQQKHKIEVSNSAIDMSYRLLNRYQPYESFPGKGIRFLAECINDAQIENRAKIKPKDILNRFTKNTGLPELFLRDDILLDQAELHAHFRQRIIGQPVAVNKLCSLVKIFKAGLNNPHKPISTLLFAGPTGVGKTESAKTLADYFFGKGQKKSPLVRIDMSEFQQPWQIYRFIGSGKETGQLVKEIRERPFSVLLLDEIEKAHPTLFDVLLGILDEGRLVDAYGRVTNFRNTIIIMTSNLGASNVDPVGFVSGENAENLYFSAIERHFRPEFINRIDGVVLFNALRRKDIEEITRKELAALSSREGFVKRGLKLRFTSRIIEHINRIGFDERYGARPLQRAIEQSIVTPMAGWLIENPVAENKEVLLDFDGEVMIA